MKATIVRPTNIFLLDKPNPTSRANEESQNLPIEQMARMWRKDGKEKWFMMDFISIAHRNIDFSNLDRRQGEAKQMKFN